MNIYLTYFPHGFSNYLMSSPIFIGRYSLYECSIIYSPSPLLAGIRFWQLLAIISKHATETFI